MDISRFLGQSVAWQSVTTTDDRDDATYAVAVPLKARKVAKLRDLIGEDGEVTTSSNQITLAPSATVKIGDLLDGRMVISVSDLRDYRGQLVGLQALTR